MCTDARGVPRCAALGPDAELPPGGRQQAPTRDARARCRHAGAGRPCAGLTCWRPQVSEESHKLPCSFAISKLVPRRGPFRSRSAWATARGVASPPRDRPWSASGARARRQRLRRRIGGARALRARRRAAVLAHTAIPCVASLLLHLGEYLAACSRLSEESRSIAVHGGAATTARRRRRRRQRRERRRATRQGGLWC